MIQTWILTTLITLAIKVAKWLIKINRDGNGLPAHKKEHLNHFLWVVEEKLRPAAVQCGCLKFGLQPPEWTDDLSSPEDD